MRALARRKELCTREDRSEIAETKVGACDESHHNKSNSPCLSSSPLATNATPQAPSSMHPTTATPQKLQCHGSSAPIRVKDAAAILTHSPAPPPAKRSRATPAAEVPPPQCSRGGGVLQQHGPSATDHGADRVRMAGYFAARNARLRDHGARLRSGDPAALVTGKRHHSRAGTQSSPESSPPRTPGRPLANAAEYRSCRLLYTPCGACRCFVTAFGTVTRKCAVGLKLACNAIYMHALTLS